MSRVYVGSFHDKPIAREEHSVLFAKDREVLLGRLRDLPKVRKRKRKRNKAEYLVIEKESSKESKEE